MRFVVVICLLVLVTTTSANHSISYKNEEALIAQLYKGLSGFKASTEDRNNVSKAGGAPTYGEITPESVSRLIAYLNVTDRDVFYDLGSGNGKAVMQMYLSTPVKKSVGVELSKQRHSQAEKAKSRAREKGLLHPLRSLQFIQGDILKTDFSEATIVYMCSTCYTPKMMQVLQNKCGELKKGSRVVTLKKFSKDKKLKLIKKFNLGMTWSKSSPVYIYKVVS